MRRYRIALIAVTLLAGSLLAATLTPASNEFRDARKLKANPQHGEVLFAICARCHQSDGSGQALAGVPNIAGQHYSFVLEQLVDFRQAERIDLRMNAAASSHELSRAQDLADVAAYVSDLPTVATRDRGPGESLAIGAALYTRACAYCHGPAGEGNGELRYPRLAGQHYRYLRTQMQAMRSGDVPNVTWDHVKLLETLTPEEFDGVAGFLARLDVRIQPAAIAGTHHATTANTIHINAMPGPSTLR